MIGSSIGPYQVLAALGAGGMGEVYRARDTRLNRQVAIKTLPRTSPEDAARLRREARAMATVLHPNLAVVYAAETWKGTPLLVTEFLEGGTLADRILPLRLPFGEVRDLGDALASALDRVHRAGILHRDMKPSNIGYTVDGSAKLLDFGLAGVIGEAEGASRRAGLRGGGEPARRRTITGHGLVGTPLYMSPEALRGEPPDTTVDLWSLAVVLYEALTGTSPVERASWGETLEVIQTARIADVRDPVGDALADRRMPAPRARAGDSRPGVGRRVRRPRPPRPSERRAHRRWLDPRRRRAGAGPRGPCGGRPDAMECGRLL